MIQPILQHTRSPTTSLQVLRILETIGLLKSIVLAKHSITIMGQSGHPKLAATRELDRFLQAIPSAVIKAIVPIIRALVARIPCPERQTTVPIWAPILIATWAVGRSAAFQMACHAQTTDLAATSTEKYATATPTATQASTV